MSSRSIEQPKKVEKIKSQKLINAVMTNRIKTIKKLLEKNYDPNVVSYDGSTCLFWAIMQDNWESFELLIKFGANVNKKTNSAYDPSPLHLVCCCADFKFVKFLINSGANINAIDNIGDTPLHDACRRGSFEIVSLLLEKGADYTKMNNDGQTPLSIAEKNNNSRIIQLFKEHIKSKEIKIEQSTPLVPLRKNIKNQDLFEAITGDNVEEVEKLLKEGRDPNVYFDHRMKTSLYWAISRRNLKIVKLLVKFGADINKSTGVYADKPPLNFACYCKELKIAEFLINSGANVNATDGNGNTPLHTACCRKPTEIIRLLLEKGADYTKINKSGQTPLMIAKKYNKSQTVEIIEEHIKSKEASFCEPVDPDLNIMDIVTITVTTSNKKVVSYKGPYKLASEFMKRFQ